MNIVDICIDCYQIIKTLVFQLENIRDTQKILKIRNTHETTNKSPTKSPVIDVKSVKQEKPKIEDKVQSTKSPVVVTTLKSQLIPKQSPSPQKLPSTPTQVKVERKRSYVEEVEQKYSNIKLRKVETKPQVILNKSETMKTPQKTTKVVVIQEIATNSENLAKKILSDQGSGKKSETSGNRSFMCISCSEKFPSFSELEVHLKKSCKGPVNSQFICFCKKLFNSKEELSSHVSAEHHQYKRHVCPVCKEVFTSPEKLKQHSTTHSKTFAPKNLLKKGNES